MPPRTELASPKTQPPKSGKSAPSPAPPGSQEYRDRLIAFSRIARRNRKYERDRRSESQWRKRSAAIASGRFRGADGFTDGDALDAFAPHGSEAIEDRHFSEAMERRELDAWSLVESAGRKGRAEYLDACRAYLRLVEAMDRAAERGLVIEPIKAFAGRSGPLKLKGAMCLQRAT